VLLHISRSKEDEILIMVVLLERLGLDPSAPDELGDGFFALAGEERRL